MSTKWAYIELIFDIQGCCDETPLYYDTVHWHNMNDWATPDQVQLTRVMNTQFQEVSGYTVLVLARG